MFTPYTYGPKKQTTPHASDTADMSRLDVAMQAHEKTLRTELANAEKKKTELEGELIRQTGIIQKTKADLQEVLDELERRGANEARQNGTTIQEDPD